MRGIMSYLNVVEQVEPTAFFARTNTGKFRVLGWGDTDINAARVMNTGREGWPDVSGQFKGRPCYIEVKAGKGRPSPAQKAVHERLRAGGAMVIEAWDVSDVERALIPRRDTAPDASDVPF